MTTDSLAPFEVRVRRDGRFWYVAVPAVDGATQARSLTEVEPMARDLIAEITGRTPSTISVDIDVELPSVVEAHLEAAIRLREEEATARARAAEESRAAARELRDSGLTVRELGIALGISYQRAQQLLTS
ncbi:MAG: hypothetical protein NVV57_04300 [Demequina sp.]|jgi:hypothetical protein|nr:hypothetical protein [Demequina sp.]